MDVAIIGGGISGLACAFQIKKRGGVTFRLFEGGRRAGGVIETRHREGFLLERGPDSFFSEKPETLKLAEELGLKSEIMETSRRFRRSYIARGGELYPVPEGFYLAAPTNWGAFFKSPLFSLPGKCRAGLELFLPARKNPSDESAASFLRRRFGNEIYARAGQPMVSGIYTGDAERLSIRSVLPRWCEFEEKHGSVIRGLLREVKGIRHKALADFSASRATREASGPRYSLFLTFRNGMGSFVEALVSGLESELEPGTRAESLERAGAGWRIHFSDGTTVETDRVCLATPAHVSARLLEPIDAGLAALLRKIPYESVMTLNAAFKREDISHPLEGFGFVVPETEKSPIVGCSFSSVKFEGRAPEGKALLRVFAGGAHGRGIFDLEDREAARAIFSVLKKLLGIRGEPFFYEIARFPKSMVQFEVGHGELAAAIRERAGTLPGLFFVGPAYGSGGAGISDAIKSGEEIAARMTEAEASSLRAAKPRSNLTERIL